VIPVAEGPLFVRAAVYPNNGQSLVELVEVAPEVVATVVVVAVDVGAEADLPPLQAVAASPTETISTRRSLIGRHNGITVQAAPASGCQRLNLRARSQRACSARSGAFSSLQSWHRSDAVRRNGSGNSPPQARQINGPWLDID
jgi:hypothetical protein